MPIDSSFKLGLVALFMSSQYVGGITRLLSWLVKCTISSNFSHHIYKNSGKQKIHIHILFVKDVDTQSNLLLDSRMEKI